MPVGFSGKTSRSAIRVIVDVQEILHQPPNGASREYSTDQRRREPSAILPRRTFLGLQAPNSG